MKKLIIISICLLAANFMYAQKANFKRYADKSGIIVYTIEGTVSGKHTLMWDNFGEREKLVRETVTSVFGLKQKDNSVELREGALKYTWKIGESEGSKMHDHMFEAMAEGTKDWNDLGERTMREMKYEKKGTETVAGKVCTLWEGPMGKNWVFKSYSIKSETVVMGIKLTTTTIRFGAGEAVAASEFALPNGVSFKNVEDVQEDSQTDDSAEDAKKQTEDAKKVLKGFLKGFGN